MEEELVEVRVGKGQAAARQGAGVLLEVVAEEVAAMEGMGLMQGMAAADLVVVGQGMRKAMAPTEATATKHPAQHLEWVIL